MDKKFAAKNIRMGVLLTLVSILMALIAWAWTALYLAVAVSK